MKVITIDGPSASGKGTVARLLAEHLQYALLDSGALYRMTAWVVVNRQLNVQDIDWAVLLNSLNIEFSDQGIVVDGVNVSQAIRQEAVGVMASQLAKKPEVRQALLEKQRAFAKTSNLVADGRDMGTVVFPQADLKIFLEADVSERAKRRYLELYNKGILCDYEQVLSDLQARDDADRNRAIAPLKPAEDAILIDSSHLTPQEVLQKILTCLA